MTYRFPRPLRRILIDVIAPGVMAVVFLAAAVVFAVQGYMFSPAESTGANTGLTRYVPPLMFGFFGTILALGTFSGIRLTLARARLEVGPDGLWAPEFGLLRWQDVEQIRVEHLLIPGADYLARTHRQTRLGIVPRSNAALNVPRSVRVLRTLTRGYWSIISKVSPRARSVAGMAPYGMVPGEFKAPLTEIVGRIREFHPVTETS
jgi:hypothetical protein